MSLNSVSIAENNLQGEKSTALRFFQTGRKSSIFRFVSLFKLKNSSKYSSFLSISFCSTIKTKPNGFLWEANNFPECLRHFLRNQNRFRSSLDDGNFDKVEDLSPENRRKSLLFFSKWLTLDISRRNRTNVRNVRFYRYGSTDSTIRDRTSQSHCRSV